MDVLYRKDYMKVQWYLHEEMDVREDKKHSAQKEFTNCSGQQVDKFARVNS